MSRATQPMGRIHAVAGDDPCLSLFAAVIRVAVEDATAGNPEARAWLAGAACLALLTWLAPETVDPATVQARILDALPLIGDAA